MKPIYAVVLAGDSEDQKVKPGAVIANKSLLPIHDRPMIDYILDCYRQVTELKGIGIVGPEKEFKGITDIIFIPQGTALIDNIKAAASHLPDGWLLFSTSDIPLISPEAIRDWLSRCYGADMYYPIVSREDSERVFPGMNRTWVKLAEGEYTGGNLLLIKSCKVSQAAGLAGAFLAARKSPRQLAGLLGVPILIRLLLKKLTISELEGKMGKILGITCKAVQTPYPEIGADVDKKTDYDYISDRLLNVAR